MLLPTHWRKYLLMEQRLFTGIQMLHTTSITTVGIASVSSVLDQIYYYLYDWARLKKLAMLIHYVHYQYQRHAFYTGQI
jgi:hypothetical protein